MADLRVPPDHDPLEVRRGAPFTFRFDGQEIVAHPGETVAAALLAAGQRELRRTRRGGQPRGMFCGIGVCFDCLVVVEGPRTVRACLTPAEASMEVRSHGGR